ncbi:MAG: hypothetical protein U0Q18_07975 [Bryobacteraceae bacterium]
MSLEGFTNSSQFQALIRIAEFSTALRGHQLMEWQERADWAAARCAWCGMEVTVRASLFEPNIDGEALEFHCGAESRNKVA